jgi:hypothetical protein
MKVKMKTKQRIATKLYAEMNGDLQKHQIDEIRGVVADKSGAVVWTDLLNSKDEVFKQVENPDPLGYSVLLVQRLGPQMDLRSGTCRYLVDLSGEKQKNA